MQSVKQAEFKEEKTFFFLMIVTGDFRVQLIKSNQKFTDNFQEAMPYDSVEDAQTAGEILKAIQERHVNRDIPKEQRIISYMPIALNMLYL